MAVSHYNQVHLIDHDRLSIIPSVTSPRQQPQQRHRLDRAHRDVPGDGWHNSGKPWDSIQTIWIHIRIVLATLPSVGAVPLVTPY